MSLPDPDPDAILSLRGELLPRLEEILREVRRQGRASMAAQAAAEACLAALPDPDDAEAEPEEASTEPDTSWLKALLPLLDAVERVSAQATSLRRARVQPRLPLWKRLLAPPEEPTFQADLDALEQGLRLLVPLTEQSLLGLGVRVERRTGIPLDPGLHRVVETRGEQATATVLEVVRPGYWLGDLCVREADVVASKSNKGNRT